MLERGGYSMNSDALNLFTEYLFSIKKLSNNTIVSYKRDLNKYYSFLRQRNVYNCSDIKNSDFEDYICYLRKNGFSDSTISRSIASIKLFHKYLFENGIINKEISFEVSAPKIVKKIPGILSIEEIDRLLEQPSTNKPKHLRDKAMLELMYATGIRVTELISLKVSDVKLKASHLICRDDGKQRVVPFGKEAKKALSLYLDKGRPSIVKDSNMHLLFTNYNGGELSRQGFWKLIKSYAVKANISTEITPHTLRHSFAAHLIENGADIHTVSEMLGHSDIASTMIYVNMNNRRIRDIYEKTHPRN